MPNPATLERAVEVRRSLWIQKGLKARLKDTLLRTESVERRWGPSKSRIKVTHVQIGDCERKNGFKKYKHQE